MSFEPIIDLVWSVEDVEATSGPPSFGVNANCGQQPPASCGSGCGASACGPIPCTM